MHYRKENNNYLQVVYNKFNIDILFEEPLCRGGHLIYHVLLQVTDSSKQRASNLHRHDWPKQQVMIPHSHKSTVLKIIPTMSLFCLQLETALRQYIVTDDTNIHGGNFNPVFIPSLKMDLCRGGHSIKCWVNIDTNMHFSELAKYVHAHIGTSKKLHKRLLASSDSIFSAWLMVLLIVYVLT